MYLKPTPSLPIIVKTYSPAHVATMIIAWVFLVPFSIICVRKREKWKWWFKAHVVLVTFAIILTIASTVFGIKAVDQKPEVDHFSSHHHVIGTLACIAAGFQFVLGIYIHFAYQPDRLKVPQRDKFHWWLGRITALLAIAATISGYIYVNMATWIYIITFLAIVFFMIAFSKSKA